MKILLSFAFIFAFCAIGFAQTDKELPEAVIINGRVSSVTNILGKPKEMTCKNPQTLTGIVMKRNFDEDEVTVTSFVLSDENDNRFTINLNNRQIDLIGHNSVRAISSLLEKGNQVQVLTYKCDGGGSGVFNYADKIAHSEKTYQTQMNDTPLSPSSKVISGGVVNGKAISLPKAVYPNSAKPFRASGAVNVLVTIDENGNVISAKAVSGSPYLRKAAEDAALLAKFAPTMLSGQVVKVTGVIVYNFVP